MAPSDDAPAVETVEAPAKVSRPPLIERYRKVRAGSLDLVAPLSPEDQIAQSMADASPVKWHLAHITWFFETFVLTPNLAGYELFDPRFGYLFNSYYEAVGARHPRPARGLLTRPSAAEVLAYRAHVDAAMERLLAGAIEPNVRDLVILGLAHEEQHQELILMDVLNLFAASPVHPAYAPDGPVPESSDLTPEWVSFAGGLVEIGADGGEFSFDNEFPRHQVLLQPYRLANRLVTNGEWLQFMADGGYRRPEFWLSDGWARVQAEGWEAPLYWECDGEVWRTRTLRGRQAGGSRGPGGSPQLLRGRRLRRLGRQASAHRGRVGARRRLGRRWPGADRWRRLAMDGQRLFAPSRFRRRGRGGGRIQRQVHGRPDGAQGRRLRHARRPQPAHLPQLLLSPSALDVRRRAPGRGRAAAEFG